jgi:hypothetical protein
MALARRWIPPLCAAALACVACGSGSARDERSHPSRDAGAPPDAGHTVRDGRPARDAGGADGAREPDAGDEEVCANREDDDGDGRVDENCATCSQGQTRSCYAGEAQYAGVGACERGMQTCEPNGEFASWGDCEGYVTPEDEVCGNGVDEDCDGTADEGCTCSPGQQRPCYSGPADTEGVGACRSGTQVCRSDGSGWGACEGDVLPSDELCDGELDEDCDGTVDENCMTGTCPRVEPIEPLRGRALVIGEAEAACPFPCMLSLDGWEVDHLPRDQDFDGTPALGPYDAVVLLDGTEWQQSMPEAGQQALIDFVSSGGGLVVLEWIAWEIGVTPRYQTLDALMPVTYADEWTTAQSRYSVRQSSHPITSTVPASFQVGRHGYSLGSLRQDATSLIRLDAESTPALAVRPFDQGRVAWFAAANGWSDFRWVTEPELTELFVRAFDWAAGEANPASGFDVSEAQSTCARR